MPHTITSIDGTQLLEYGPAFVAFGPDGTPVFEKRNVISNTTVESVLGYTTKNGVLSLATEFDEGFTGHFGGSLQFFARTAEFGSSTVETTPLTRIGFEGISLSDFSTPALATLAEGRIVFRLLDESIVAADLRTDPGGESTLELAWQRALSDFVTAGDSFSNADAFPTEDGLYLAFYTLSESTPADDVERGATLVRVDPDTGETLNQTGLVAIPGKTNSDIRAFDVTGLSDGRVATVTTFLEFGIDGTEEDRASLQVSVHDADLSGVEVRTVAFPLVPVTLYDTSIHSLDDGGYALSISSGIRRGFGIDNVQTILTFDSESRIEGIQTYEAAPEDNSNDALSIITSQGAHWRYEAFTRGLFRLDDLPSSTGVTIADGGASRRLEGTGRDDTIEAGGGRDILIGFGGMDVMTGGAGADVFVLTQVGDDAGPESGAMLGGTSLEGLGATAGPAATTITDWEAGADRLAIDDQLLRLGDDKVDIRDLSRSVFKDLRDSGAVGYNSRTGELRLDIDGDGDRELVATLEGGAVLGLDDVLLF